MQNKGSRCSQRYRAFLFHPLPTAFAELESMQTGLLILLSLSHTVFTTHATYYGLVTVPERLMEQMSAQAVDSQNPPVVPLPWSFQVYFYMLSVFEMF